VDDERKESAMADAFYFITNVMAPALLFPNVSGNALLFSVLEMQICFN